MVSSLLTLLPKLERSVPALAAELALARWRTPRPPREPRAEAQYVLDDADMRTHRIAGRRIATYRWGSGPDVVLLVHGWEGRASDFAPIVHELRSRNRTIIGLDAPGHGRSSGRRTTVPEYGSILAELARTVGHLEAVVSHSFGTPAVAVATGLGLSAERFVSLSGVAEMGNLISTYCGALGLTDTTASRMRVLAENRMFHGDRSVWDRLSAPRSPLPEGSPLLIVHDRDDLTVAFSESEVLARAHGSATRVLATEGLGHSRILRADLVLEAVADFLGEPSAMRDRDAAPV